MCSTLAWNLWSLPLPRVLGSQAWATLTGVTGMDVGKWGPVWVGVALGDQTDLDQGVGSQHKAQRPVNSFTCCPVNLSSLSWPHVRLFTCPPHFNHLSFSIFLFLLHLLPGLSEFCFVHSSWVFSDASYVDKRSGHSR